MQDTTPSESQDPDKTRSDSLASGNRDGTDSDKMERDDQSQAVPEWLQNFPENLEEPQIPVPAHTSQEDSDLERPTKLVEKHNLCCGETRPPTLTMRQLFLF